MKIKAPKDFWAGLLFVAFGMGFLAVSQTYRMGTAFRMGPAYFPSILGGLLAFLGASILFRSFTVAGQRCSDSTLGPTVRARSRGLVGADAPTAWLGSFDHLFDLRQRAWWVRFSMERGSGLGDPIGRGVSKHFRLWPRAAINALAGQ